MAQTSLAASSPTVSLHPQHILVFDSGLGGLSVLREITRQMPAADVTYVADDAAFPYGNWQEPALIDRVVALIGDLIHRHRPDLIVIACNTASTLVLPPLRARYSVPFVGTVPAIKPAAEATRSGLVSVLATPGTVARDYTRQLIDRFAGHAQVKLVGSTRLAAIAEDWLRGVRVDAEAIRAEIAPCFVEAGGVRTDTIVLGCTHYPLLIEPIRRVAPWDVHWIDGAEAIARRAYDVLGATATEAVERPDATPDRRAIFTSGKPIGGTLSERLAEFGLQT